MTEPIISLAIETSCRRGGVALGRDGLMTLRIDFDASARHATQLIRRLDEMLRRAGLRPRDVHEIYVSAGPGSFTGLRVGLTVARTMAQAVPGVRCVAVPTAQAVAENARDLAWEHLAVVFDAREGLVYANLFTRRHDQIVPTGPGQVMTPGRFLETAPRPLLLIGEGLAYHDLSAPQAASADASLNAPTAEGVLRVGWRMARAGEFTDYQHLLPIYTRPSWAVGTRKGG